MWDQSRRRHRETDRVTDGSGLHCALDVLAWKLKAGVEAILTGPAIIRTMDTSRFKPTPIPRERRRSQLARFTLYDARDETIEVIVRDISSRGLSAVAASNPPAINEIVRARLDDGRELWGLVRWTDGSLFGVEFDTQSR
jgi:hypothetical protein